MPPRSSSRRASSIVATGKSGAGAGAGVRVGPPLSKTTSQSAVSIEEGEEKEEDGKAVWFSTREETLGELPFAGVTPSSSADRQSTGQLIPAAPLTQQCDSTGRILETGGSCGTLTSSNGRPYVLRDASVPFQTLTLSNRAPNLEDIERRLKTDILEEARRYGGMILFHDEDEHGHLVPTWMSVDETSIRTPREVWENEKAKGWRVEYHRIPIAPDTPIEVSCRIPSATCAV